MDLNVIESGLKWRQDYTFETYEIAIFLSFLGMSCVLLYQIAFILLIL